MLRAERRRWSDLVAAATIAVVIVVAVALLAGFGPAARTSSVTLTGPIPVTPPAPDDVPATLTELWRAPSAATPSPVTDGPLVVTGDNDAGAGGGTVLGRDPLTGQTRWSYHRELSLCTVGSGWHTALAVFRQGEYCSEVTQLTPATGARVQQRNSDVHPEIRLIDLGNLVGAAGADYLEAWRIDLIKTVMYGATRTDAQPNRQPHRGCRHLSTTGTQGRVAVLERCPDEATDRLTVLRPDGEQGDRPELEFSVTLPSDAAKLVAVSADRVAVVLPNPTRLSIRDGAGTEVASLPLDLPPADLTVDQPGSVPATADGLRTVAWWTGSRTVGLDVAELRPTWTVPDSLGPGTVWAGRLVVPVRAGLAVLNADNGAPLRTIPMGRGGWKGPVSLSALGPVLLEQRGPTVVALH
ncbi:MAG: Rv3212 family protein [Pseudonocardia sp.]